MLKLLMQTEIILHILLSLGLIIIATKWCAVLAQKFRLPSVVGMIVAGLLLKLLPIFNNFGGITATDAADLVVRADSDKFISYIAEIGVVMIMYSSGLGTNLRTLLRSGPKALLVALGGVLIPLILGSVVSYVLWRSSLFESSGGGGNPHELFLKALFIGTILTATSVSITAATLKELGAQSTPAGLIIIASAIIDDVIGIIVLTLVTGVAGSGLGGGATNINLLVGKVALKTLLFFVASVVVGFFLYHVFKWYDARHEHTRRMAIYGLGCAFVLSYCAEKFFEIADITGAYIAGVIFCNLRDAKYMEEKIDVNSYMLFSPVFFASIGLKTSVAALGLPLVIFSLCFVFVGCLAKIIGAGGVGRLLGFGRRESLSIGVGMMVRGEVALIVAQKGLACGLVDRVYFTPVILLIIVSSIIAPILLKVLFGRGESGVEMQKAAQGRDE